GGLDGAGAGDDTPAGILDVGLDGVAEVAVLPAGAFGFRGEGDLRLALRVGARLALGNDLAIAVVGVVIPIAGVGVEKVEGAGEGVGVGVVGAVGAVGNFRARHGAAEVVAGADAGAGRLAEADARGFGGDAYLELRLLVLLDAEAVAAEVARLILQA